MAKILVRWMKRHLNNLIAEEQSAFVDPRSIIDDGILAQEAMHQIHTFKSVEGYMVVKVDIEQAFDRIR